MRNVKNLALFVLMLALVNTAAVADIHYVNPGESIQAAIDTADPGDEIEVAPGTYTEAIDFIGKAIRLYSSGGPDVTTIDGTGHYHVVQCVTGEGSDTTLEGFTITGGNATGTGLDGYGGGMWIFESSPTVTNCIFNLNNANSGGGLYTRLGSPTLTDCTFTQNTAEYDGAGMGIWEVSPTVTNCTFSGNTANRYGGGIHIGLDSSPTVTNCTFTDNTASVDGGGMWNDNCSPTVTNCTFTDNTASVNGGGMYNRYSSPLVTNCTFSGNTASSSGGGMWNYGSSPTVDQCTFTDNTASVDGGGMYSNNSSPTVSDCTFSSNGSNWGAGMYNFESHSLVTNCTFSGNTCVVEGGGMCNYGGSTPTVTTCNFLNNTAGWNGGGICNDGGSPTVTDCIFTLNMGEYGGGMYNGDGSPTVTNCTISGNIAIDGGGMHNDNASPTVTNCTFTGNTAIDGGGIYNDNSSPTVTNCILWGDAGGEIFVLSGTPTITYSDVQGGWPGTGNIGADPLFADADGRLSFGSPCIDAGNDVAIPPGVTTDLDGNPRIQGACVDMGAFESEFTALDFSGWVWMESSGDFGYSQDEDGLLYLLSFGPVWYYNTATSLWGEEGPVGWVYVNWPYLYESDTSTMMFALPPESGLWVYHFRTGQWTVSPRIMP